MQNLGIFCKISKQRRNSILCKKNASVLLALTRNHCTLKAGGKVLMIDGGFSKAYHEKTGMSGYTLAIDSHGMWLVQHEKFESKAKAIAV